MVYIPPDAVLRQILTPPKTVACVGVSPDPVRPSHFVARYLSRRGFRVVPINPRHAGTVLFGETVVADLSEVERTVDILDVFRRPDAVPEIAADGLSTFPHLSCVWLQIGITSVATEGMCAERGVTLIQDRCPKIEHQRLFGELRMGGFATGIISSKRP